MRLVCMHSPISLLRYICMHEWVNLTELVRVDDGSDCHLLSCSI